MYVIVTSYLQFIEKPRGNTLLGLRHVYGRLNPYQEFLELTFFIFFDQLWLFLKELLLFYFFSVLDVWDVYRGLFARIKRRVYLSESQPRVHSDSSIIHCTINPNLFSDKFAYKLTICNHRIKIMASDLIGKFLVYVFYWACRKIQHTNLY